MSKKPGRRSSKRGPKRRPEDEAPSLPATADPPRPPFRDLTADFEDHEVLSYEWYDIKMLAKITEKTQNALTGHVTYKMIPFEDSIHPVKLNFEPPLIELAPGDTKGFYHHWEKLTYAFDLPDPEEFPQLPALTDPERELIDRFIVVCRRLATYSTINSDGGMKLSTDRFGEWSVSVREPSEEAFAGACLAFRQLHSGNENASFDNIKGFLFKATRTLPDAESRQAQNLLRQWARARAALMNRMLQTIVALKAGPEDPPEDVPVSFINVNPEELLLTYNYGDTIHFTERRQQLSELTEIEADAAYYKHAVLLTIIGLSHLYFGFSKLLEAAIRP
ncbi:hypothetical protein PP484_gp48 [Gordonia phage Madeline]|uniref:Uncharacterized protein n=1 Tax=Gordonia phage Madeline TaxID=2591189 RepID=A0A514A321_9CAUD|nr:hypothetical protein PP484_gp48 [Gordonia phage Madeline]QDH47665.1 hypothetical protein SEA_MADELINE_62 [Gordonia phage Madeline]